MRLSAVLPFAALAITAAAESVSYDEYQVHARDSLAITEEEVDTLDLYAKYSTTAYCNVDKEDGEPITCTSSCGRAAEDGGIVLATYKGPKTKVQAYVALVESRKQIIFIGKATATNDDWAINLDFETIPSDLVEGGMIHQGFSNAWDDISEAVTDTIAHALLNYPGYKVIATGHSLGGALAAVAAANLRSAGYEVDHYSYGSPRIGNEALSKFISNQDGATYRVTLRRDPIPQLPPAIYGEFGKYRYRHISPEYWLTGYPSDPTHWPVEDIKTCPGSLNWFCNSDWTKMFNFTDHGSYFGPMACMFPIPPNFINGVFFPREIQLTVQDLIESGS